MARPFFILELERNLGWCTSLSVYQRSNSQTIWHALQSLVSLSVVQTYIFHMRFSGMLRVNWGKLIDNNRGIIDKNPCVLVTILIRTMCIAGVFFYIHPAFPIDKHISGWWEVPPFLVVCKTTPHVLHIFKVASHEYQSAKTYVERLLETSS